MKQDSEDKLAHVLEALENPSSFTQEELKSLFSDKECLRYARTILYAKESLARQQIPQPDIDKEWRTFERHHKKTSIIPIIIGLAIASCIALFFIFSLSKEVEGGLRVFEATQTVQIVKEETVNGMTTVYVPRGMQNDLNFLMVHVLHLMQRVNLLTKLLNLAKTNERLYYKAKHCLMLQKILFVRLLSNLVN